MYHEFDAVCIGYEYQTQTMLTPINWCFVSLSSFVIGFGRPLPHQVRLVGTNGNQINVSILVALPPPPNQSLTGA